MARMKKEQVLAQIEEQKIFAVLRLQEVEKMRALIVLLREAGMRTFEITLNSKHALQLLHDLSREYTDCLFGAGTVIGYDSAVRAVESGARFLVSPVTDLEMLAVAKELSVATMAGALTPTEAWQATEAGADMVKLFPLAGIGPEYIKALRGPFPALKLVATNGVTPENAFDYFQAGVTAVGAGSSLVNDVDMQGDLQEVARRAERLMVIAREVREAHTDSKITQ